MIVFGAKLSGWFLRRQPLKKENKYMLVTCNRVNCGVYGNSYLQKSFIRTSFGVSN